MTRSAWCWRCPTLIRGILKVLLAGPLPSSALLTPVHPPLDPESLTFNRPSATAIAAGPTNVSGVISSNTSWTLANSPYIVTGNILVSQGVTLTVQPGVTVTFDGNYFFQVDGTLVADGAADNTIVFTRSTGSWGPLQFTDSSSDAIFDGEGKYVSGSLLRYVRVENGGGIFITNSSPFIFRSTISQNSGQGVGAIRVNGGAPVVSYNIIEGNGACCGLGGALTIQGNSTATVTNNLFRNNSGDGGIVNLGGGGQRVTFKDNFIEDNLDGTALQDWSSGSVITGNLIRGNRESGSLGMLATFSSQSVITGNTIISNTVFGPPMVTGRHVGSISEQPRPSLETMSLGITVPAARIRLTHPSTLPCPTIGGALQTLAS